MRVAVVADEPLVRAGLTALLEEGGGFVVVAAVPTADAHETLPEVGAVDAIVWELPGGELAELDTDLDAPVLLLVPAGTSVRGLLAAGARAVLTRGATPPQLRAALGAVAAGLVVLGRDAEVIASGPADGPLEPLTRRERDVLALLAEGLPNKAIARRLEMSEHTVKFHVASLLTKFGARTRTEVVARSVRSGQLPV